jgi:hypothetical protein
MALHVRIAAMIATGLALATLACACGSGGSGDEASPSATPSPRSSTGATSEARDALRRFFAAWRAKDVAALESLMPADRKNAEWAFDGLDRVEFGKITESPELVDQYMTNGRGSASGVAREDVRCFQADVTFFYKPGYQGSADEGQPLAWHWFLERDATGRWLVTDQGF